MNKMIEETVILSKRTNHSIAAVTRVTTSSIKGWMFAEYERNSYRNNSLQMNKRTLFVIVFKYEIAAYLQ
jgi:hypothetical protein